MMANVSLTPPRLTLIGQIVLGMYGGFTGSIAGISAGALATVNGYDKRFPWLLRLAVIAASALVGAMSIPFTFPQEFFVPNQ